MKNTLKDSLQNKIRHIQSKVLQGSSINLVPYNESHDRQTVDWLGDDEVRNGFGFTGDITLDDHRTWIDQSPHVMIWAITTITESEHIGNILLHLDQKEKTAYFQMYIGESELRGKGLGWDSLRTCLQCAFEDLGLDYVSLHVFPDNLPAIRLYEKAGFRKESTEKEVKMRDGSLCTQYRYVLSRTDWARVFTKPEVED
jgi:RimJ/RimL family protein N-acetyltransferase